MGRMALRSRPVDGSGSVSGLGLMNMAGHAYAMLGPSGVLGFLLGLDPLFLGLF